MRAILEMQDWASRVAETFSMIKYAKLTSAHAESRINSHIREELNRKHGASRFVYSRYMQGYVQGLIDAHRAEIWRLVEFCYVDADGVIFSTHNGSSHRSTDEFYDSGRGNELADMASGHFWIGTDYPYTVPDTMAQRQAARTVSA